MKRLMMTSMLILMALPLWAVSSTWEVRNQASGKPMGTLNIWINTDCTAGTVDWVDGAGVEIGTLIISKDLGVLQARFSGASFTFFLYPTLKGLIMNGWHKMNDLNAQFAVLMIRQ